MLANVALASIAVAYDAGRVAIGQIVKVRVLPSPFERSEFDLGCSNARAFSHDGRLLACDSTLPEIWDVAKHSKVAAAPKDAPKGPSTARFSSDDKSLLWATDHAIVRWDFATTGNVATIYTTPDRIGDVAFSESGSAFVTQRPEHAYTGGHASIIELASGHQTPLPDTYSGTMSPSGRLVAIIKPTEVDVLEAAGGKLVWKGTVTPPIARIAFGEDDSVLAFTEGHAVRVIELPAGSPRTFDAPSRFAGWLGNGIAAVDRAGKLAALTLATTTWGSADRGAILPARPSAAPAWAQWLAEAPNGVIAAESSKRHDIDVRHRDVTECEGKLRVWTASGGTKTLVLACNTKDDATPDPGWEIGGGWVVALTTSVATLYDATTGRHAAALPIDKAANPKFPSEYWASALAPDGSALALVWRHPHGVGGDGASDPREDVMHQAEERDNQDCDHDLWGKCVQDYTVEVWTLGQGAPTRVWREALAVPSSGVLAFDHAGKHLVVGLDNGDLQVWDTTPAHPSHTVSLHHFGITRISVAPGDEWVFSEDRAAEQRLWRLSGS